jgi:hypothetical protein
MSTNACRVVATCVCAPLRHGVRAHAVCARGHPTFPRPQARQTPPGQKGPVQNPCAVALWRRTHKSMPESRHRGLSPPPHSDRHIRLPFPLLPFASSSERHHHAKRERSEHDLKPPCGYRHMAKHWHATWICAWWAPLGVQADRRA